MAGDLIHLFIKRLILKNFNRQWLILLSDNSSNYPRVILVPFRGLATFQLSRYGQPKSENSVFQKHKRATWGLVWLKNLLVKNQTLSFLSTIRGVQKLEAVRLKFGKLEQFLFFLLKFWPLFNWQSWVVNFEVRLRSPWHFLEIFFLSTNVFLPIVHLIKFPATSDVSTSTQSLKTQAGGIHPLQGVLNYPTTQAW